MSSHLALDVTHIGLHVALSDFQEFDGHRIVAVHAPTEPYFAKAALPQLPHALNWTKAFKGRTSGSDDGGWESDADVFMAF